jgi:hypothetical protein
VLFRVRQTVVLIFTAIRFRVGIRFVAVKSMPATSSYRPIHAHWVKLPDPDAKSFTPEILKDAMMKTISSLNAFAAEAGITEPSLMNFCITDGQTVIATRYISSRTDEAASLVCLSAELLHLC